MRLPSADAARGIARRLKPHAASIAIALAAIAVAWTFVDVTLRHTHRFGLPIEDAYIYLTYAKQFGRGQPFTYYPGGGYSAGSTSVLWPILLAPFWTLGARGHHLVWVSFALCTALYAATCVACQLLVRRMFGALAGLYAGLLAMAIAPFAFTALAGMEVGFASALLLITFLLIARTPLSGKPTRVLVACLAATSLSRPEAMMIVVAIVGSAVVLQLRQRDLRAAAWWAAPLIAPVLWLGANRVFAGHWFPNTGVVKSHFYLPGFDWSYWRDAVEDQTLRMAKRLFWGDGIPSPFVWEHVIAACWFVGAVRVVRWARREQQWRVAALVVGSPLILMLAVIASSGAWDFHNYRYIAPAFPLVMLTAACALAPVRLPERARASRAIGRLSAVAGIVFVLLFLRAARTSMTSDIDLYAQNAADLERQVVTIGNYVHDQLPDATIMFHDAGAIAYYGDRPVYDMLGLVTNFQADVANNGPGARFEFLESLPPERRPTHFAYYARWMGQREFYGDVLLHTPLGRPFSRRRMVGDADMQVIVANWDHVHTAERPLVEHPGWDMIDRVDIADVASEHDHGWSGDLGRRSFGAPTARWSFFHRQVLPVYALDGGRTIRRGGEQLSVHVNPSKPVRLVLRTGGDIGYLWNAPIRRDVVIRILAEDGHELARATIPRPTGELLELSFDVNATAAVFTFRTEADGAYHAFHWFVLQPE